MRHVRHWSSRWCDPLERRWAAARDGKASGPPVPVAQSPEAGECAGSTSVVIAESLYPGFQSSGNLGSTSFAASSSTLGTSDVYFDASATM